MVLLVAHLKRLFITLVALLFATPLFAQFDFPAMTVASAAMGGASVALDDDATALYNVAGLATVENVFASASVRQNYILEGFGFAAAGVAAPLGNGAAAITLTGYGNQNYNEQQLSLLYALPLGQNLSLGAAFHYLHSATSDAYYTPLSRLTFSVALQYSPAERLLVGFKAYNPVAVVAESSDAVAVPALFNVGVSYWLRDELFAVAEIEKNLYRDASLRFGMRYVFLDYYSLFAGLATNPLIYSFGAAMNRDHLGLGIALQLHSSLGITPQLSLNYCF